MSGGYKHSYVFQNLKTTKETILENYSSSQYMEVLDTLIYKYMKPILENTDFANDLIANFIHQYVNNHRRKISIVKREKLLSSLLMYFLCEPSKRLSHLKSMRLERSIFRYIAEKFIDQTKDYNEQLIKRINGDKTALINLETRVKLLKNENTLPLLTIITSVETYLKEAAKFKQQILEKYTRMILMAAQTHYKLKNQKLDLDSIIQTMFLYSAYAIDKYDTSQGALTSYINTWLQHARNRVTTNESGKLFVVPANKQYEINNEAESYEDYVETLSDEVIEDQFDDGYILRVRELAKLVDPTGLGRLSLNIQETLTKKERLLQYAQSIKL